MQDFNAIAAPSSPSLESVPLFGSAPTGQDIFDTRTRAQSYQSDAASPTPMRDEANPAPAPILQVQEAPDYVLVHKSMLQAVQMPQPAAAASSFSPRAASHSPRQSASPSSRARSAVSPRRAGRKRAMPVRRVHGPVAWDLGARLDGRAVFM